MFTLSYIWVFALISFGIISPWITLVVLSLPKAISAIKGFVHNSVPLQLNSCNESYFTNEYFFWSLIISWNLPWLFYLIHVKNFCTLQKFFYFTLDHDSFVMFYQLSFILRSRNEVMRTEDKYVIT